MRYLALIICSLLTCALLSAQTNTFPSSGNAGIGTTSPGALLHVTQNAPNGNQITIEGTGTGAQKAGIDFKSNTATIGTIGFLPPWEFRMGATIASSSYFTTLYSGGSETMRLTNGNVGIGTSSPAEKLDISGNMKTSGYILIGTTSLPSVDAKLAVDGAIYSRKVKVTQTGWADYVFHATYRLRPLSEVEQYIQQYQHLPEVPSAADVEKDGIDLGDNQATLLKKIEELTLYLIEQNKKLETLEKEMQQLKRANNGPVN